jgi:hypothetical protein
MNKVPSNDSSQVLFLVGPAKDVQRLSRGKRHSPLTVGTTPGRRKDSNGSRGKEGTLPKNYPTNTDKENNTDRSSISYSLRDTKKRKKDISSH